MAHKHTFEETLYRVLQDKDSSGGAKELKTHLDSDPQFKAEFDQTRSAVVSLQGLAPKKDSTTFSDLDFDKLSRDILKGYRTKLGQVVYDLGALYVHEIPQKDFAEVNRFEIPKEQDSRTRLEKVGASIRSVAEPQDPRQAKYLEWVRSAEKVTSERFESPGERALGVLDFAKVLNPRNGQAWYRQALAHLRLKEFDAARMKAETAFDLARSEDEKTMGVLAKGMSFYLEDRFLDAHKVFDGYLQSGVNSIYISWNLAFAKLGLVDGATLADELCKLFVRAEESDLNRKTIEGGIEVANHWGPIEGDAKAKAKLVHTAKLYLGERCARLIEAK